MQASIPLGTVLQNRYRILSVLGQGGFGRTYLAEDQSRFKELCAIKELILPSAGDYALQKSKELFQREAQVLYQIRHPQVPQFHATFEQDGRFLIVQDYIQGKTYREQLEQLRSQGYVFSEPEVQQMIQQLLPTLSYLHGQGIIHRDISPENVILRERDRLPVLIDFGVVKELATKIQSPNQSQSIQATTVGKVGFAPSEQMQTGRAFPNSDLYALAVTAIVLLTGREPQELLDDRTMQWHWQRWATVSPGFAAVLNRMLSFAPGDRYASAMDVQQALQTMNQPGIPAAPQPSAPTPVAAPPAPPTQATVAVGTPQRAPARRPVDETEFVRSDSMVPRRSSLWDDPFAILAVGLGLMFIAGIGTWAAFNAMNRRTAQPEPTPIASATPTPTPDNEPQVFSQPLELTPGKLATRSAKLKANETLNFTFSGAAGQALKTSLTGEGVLLTLLGPDGQPLSSATKRVASWQGELPESGRYTISLSVVQGLPEGEFSLETTLTNPVKPTPTPTLTPTPTPTPSATPTPDPTPPSPSPSPEPSKPETKQILIPQGETGVTERGQVAANQTQRYLVGARKGQILEVRVDNARLNIYYPDGKPVDNGAGVKGRSLQLSQDGDYIIDVSSAENTDFQLKVDVTN